MSKTKLFLLILLSTFSFSLFADSYFRLNDEKGNDINMFVKEATETSLKLKITVNGFYYKDKKLNGEDYASVFFYDKKYSSEIGKPKIPVTKRTIEIFENSEPVMKYNIIKSRTISMRDLKLKSTVLIPVQPSRFKMKGYKAQFRKDEYFYNSDLVYPAKVMKLGKTQSFRGSLIAPLEIAPVKYNPKREELFICEEMDVTITFKSGERVFKANEAFTEGSFFNDIVLSSRGSNRTKGALTSGGLEGFLVISGNQFINNAAFKAFIRWKQEKGYKIKVASINDVGNDPDSIRKYVKREYNTWAKPALSYLLLLGDTPLIATYRGKAGDVSEGGQDTDNYYAAIDKDNYEEDISSPDIAVGRIPVKTDSEATTVLEKILRYETGKSVGTWLKKASFIATDDEETFESTEKLHNVISKDLMEPAGFSGSFPSAMQAGGDKLFAVTNKATNEDVLEAMNEGRNIIAFSGHGLEQSWDGPVVTNQDVLKLKNSARPFVMSFSCLTAAFNYQGGEGSENNDSFGEAWLKNRNGAVSYLGATSFSLWDEDNIMEHAVFKDIFKGNVWNVGVLRLKGLARVNEAYNGERATNYYYEIYHSLGDPTTELMTDIPSKLDATVEKGNNQLIINVESSKNEANGTKAVLFFNNGKQVVSIANETGTITIKLNESDYSVPCKLTLTKHNHIPLQKELNL